MRRLQDIRTHLLLGATLWACGEHGSPTAEPPEHEEQDHRIFFERRTFVPMPDVADFLASGQRHGILQLDESPYSLAPIRTLEIQIHGAQRNLAYYVSVPTEVTAEDLRALGVRALFAMEPLDKISSRLIPLDAKQPLTSGDVRISLHYVAATDRDMVSTALAQSRATVLRLEHDQGRAVLELPAPELLTLARETWVWWIDANLAPQSADMDVATVRIGANEIRPSPWGNLPVGTGLTGDGVAVGIWEVPLSGQAAAVLDDHPDLIGRIMLGPDQSTAPSFHATSVAGIIAGDGTASQAQGGEPFQWAGVAPEAQVVSWDDVDSPAEMATSAALFGTTITNHSFGIIIASEPLCGIAGRYELLAMDYDAVVRDWDITAFVSPGNNGDLVGPVGCTVDVWHDGVLDPLAPEIVDAGYGSVSVLGVAKNPVAVGGRRKSEPFGAAPYSGRGPTRDGRLKPDLVAIGGDEDSPLTMPSTPQIYDSDLGVSYAVPQATGAAALLLEHYRQGDPSFIQDPAVFKAVLANTAADVGIPGPDYANGFGLIQIDQAVSAADSYLKVQLGQADIEEIPLDVDLTDACELRVMAVWNDPPAMGAAFPRLVNDIDLSVESGDGEVLPWVLTPSNPLNAAIRGVNSIDNIEQVTIDEPSGDEVVRLFGTNVPMGPQEVVVHWYAVPCDAGAEGGDGTGGGNDDGGAGCACATSRRRSPGMPCWLLALIAAGAPRRR